MTAGKLLLSREAYSDRLLLRSSFPTSPATFGMRQDVSDVKPSIRIVDLSDQAKLFAFDIETRPLAYGVRPRKVVRRSTRSLALFVQRCFEIGVPSGGLPQLLAADDVHGAP
jgi:hypothetical protein